MDSRGTCYFVFDDDRGSDRGHLCDGKAVLVDIQADEKCGRMVRDRPPHQSLDSS